MSGQTSTLRALRGKDAELFAHAGLAFGGDELESIAATPTSVGEVIGLAEAMTGLEDWGLDDTWQVGLEVLIDSIERLDPPAAWRHSWP